VGWLTVSLLMSIMVMPPPPGIVFELQSKQTICTDAIYRKMR
jgi:hypothetical protein